jgi:hypothetical protein
MHDGEGGSGASAHSTAHTHALVHAQPRLQRAASPPTPISFPLQISHSPTCTPSSPTAPNTWGPLSTHIHTHYMSLTTLATCARRSRLRRWRRHRRRRQRWWWWRRRRRYRRWLVSGSSSLPRQLTASRDATGGSCYARGISVDECIAQLETNTPRWAHMSYYSRNPHL